MAGHPSAGQVTRVLLGVRLHSRNQVMFLAVEFLLGMAVNLLGLPSETTGAAHAATIAFLAGHIVVAAGLLAGAFVVVRAAARAGSRWRRLAIWGAAAIVVTAAALAARRACACREAAPRSAVQVTCVADAVRTAGVSRVPVRVCSMRAAAVMVAAGCLRSCVQAWIWAVSRLRTADWMICVGWTVDAGSGACWRS